MSIHPLILLTLITLPLYSGLYSGPNCSWASSIGKASPKSDLGFVNGTRLKLLTLVAIDGTQSPYGWLDTSLNMRCSFLTSADGALRCLPTDVAALAGGFYSDALCKSALAVVPEPLSSQPDAIFDRSTRKVYKLGPIFTSDQIYVRANGTCIGTERSQKSQTIYGIGPELKPDEFVSATVELPQP